MLQALTAPVLSSSVLLGALTVGAAAYVASQPTEITRRLVLHAVERPDSVYMTAWACGDVILTYDEDELTPLRFTTRRWLTDGCQWEGIETLVPLDDHRYAYDYRETILACVPDAIPAYKTPRKGLVTVEPY